MTNKLSFTFPQFYGIWYNKFKHRYVPQLEPAKFHKKLFDFLLDYPNWVNDTGVLQVPRNGTKSTIISLFITYQLIIDPAQVILVQSSNDRMAGKILDGIQDLIRTHPLAAHLAQTEREWRKRSFFVTGAVDAQNPSVSSLGIASNITGKRANWIIYDDVEAAGNANTEDKRKQLRRRLDEGINVIHPGAKRLFIGTPHTYDTYYDEQIKRGASTFTMPFLLNAKGKWPKMTGECFWPERFSDEEAAAKQKSMPEYQWMSQYMLVPWNMQDTVLDPNDLEIYEDKLELREGNGISSLHIGDKQMISVATYWDVSSGKKGKDDSVLAIVFIGSDGHYYIHKIYKLMGSGEQQCAMIEKFARENYLPSVTVEQNGVGYMAPDMLRAKLQKHGIAVLTTHQKTDKGERIIGAFHATLSSGFVHVHRSVFNSPFRTQMRDFSIGASKKDDYLDSAASAILMQPKHINSSSLGKYHSNAGWRAFANTNHEADKYDPFNK